MRILIIITVFMFLTGCGKTRDESSSSSSGKDSKETVKEREDQDESSESNEGSTPETKQSEIGNIRYNVRDIPSSAKYRDRIKGTAEWDDNNGRNLVIISETDIHTTKGENEDGRGKEIYGYHYIIDGDNAKLLWDINDFIKDCPVDVTADYVENSLSISDINNNGVGESTFLYRLSCKGDVSPDDLKLMMHENDTKYAIRGESEIQYKSEGRTISEGGNGKPDTAFNNAPNGFLKYAQEQWEKFKTVKY